MAKKSPSDQRCAWAIGDSMMERYHDEEWGRPVHDSRALFEKLLLDGLQAGLSWRTILHRREGLQQALDHFDPFIMARYDATKIAGLLKDPRLIRNRLKVQALVGNAQAYVALSKRSVDFSHMLWRCVGERPQQHLREPKTAAPSQSLASVTMSKLLSAHHFKFVGPTICYAFMQAVGMVNDHDVCCPLHRALGGPLHLGA